MTVVHVFFLSLPPAKENSKDLFRGKHKPEGQHESPFGFAHQVQV